MPQLTLLVILLSGLLCLPVFGEEAGGPPRYLVDIELQTADEFRDVLERAEQLVTSGELSLEERVVPVAFVMHGPGVHLLLRQNYLANKPLVDLAASLSALGVVEIRACKMWMGGDGIDPGDLQPFVTTVDFALEEIRRLVENEEYLYF